MTATTLLVTSVGTARAVVPTPNQNYVTYLYNVVLDRTPAADEVNYWAGILDGGAPTSAVANAFWASTDGRNVQITNYYDQFLGRAADAGGAAYFRSLYNAGYTTHDIIAVFLGSPEGYADAGGTPATFVNALYDTFASHAPAAAEVNYWVGVVNTYGPTFAARIFLQNQEPIVALVADTYGDNCCFNITNVINDALFRSPQLIEAQFWSESISRGSFSLDQFIVYVLASAEAYDDANH
jgi:hypothetical protein